MALNTVNTYLKEKQMAPIHNFLKTLREDMIEYKTLPTNTLRRISGVAGKTSKALNELVKLKNELGPDYLKKLKERIGALDEEVIIAVENQKNSNISK